MQGVAFSADDEHDHDHSAHSDEPFYGHVGIRLHADHVSDAGEGAEEGLAIVALTSGSELCAASIDACTKFSRRGVFITLAIVLTASAVMD